MSIRSVVLWMFALFAMLASGAALAAEKINDFSVDIDVKKNGDITITETIAVTSEGNQIRRGIFRDLPRYFDQNGAKLAYDYDVNSVTRDGKRESYAIERQRNAFRIRIGDADVFLQNGNHVYEIQYSVKNQIRYFEDFDELYWNVTGTYWAFPIDQASAQVTLPEGAKVTQRAAYTGHRGQSGGDYSYRQVGGDHVFTTSRSLASTEGLTIALGFEKGAVDPPSAADKRAQWFAVNASALVLSSAIALLSLFYSWTYMRAGRDPARGPVFPRYEPPEGYSPAGVHYIYRRMLAGNQALIATILNLAIKDAISIDAQSKKKTKLTLKDSGGDNLFPAERTLLNKVFNRREEFTLGSGYDTAFTSAYTAFQKDVSNRFGSPYFKWNSGYLILSVLLTAAAIVVGIKLSVFWSVWHTVAVLALGAMLGAFAYFIPAPTMMGQKIRTEIEGFRLYLKTAEKIYLDAVEPGAKAPPPMTVERYERFLPYAVALGVEEPWTRHFENLIPQEAANYQPRWAHGYRRGDSLHGLNKAFMSGMSSGVATALPQSSSSSGSGGGGFSGGGGGGGGGGGW